MQQHAKSFENATNALQVKPAFASMNLTVISYVS